MKIKQLLENRWLTDGGLETTLIYHYGIDLPHFAAFELLSKPHYQLLMLAYYRQYMKVAKKYQAGFILESATWRANPDWGFKMGYSDLELLEINRQAVNQLRTLEEEFRHQLPEILISGCIGPRSDGYQVGTKMSAAEAADYHALQVCAFKQGRVDLTTAMTINYINEGLGIARAAKARDLPLVISFTVETDGQLPSGEPLEEAILRIDQDTGNYPLYYMINCAHPSHFYTQLIPGSDWLDRLGGIRANASCRSHAELDEATDLDAGDPRDLANWYRKMSDRCPSLRAFGGCCGTDISHLEAIGGALFSKILQ